MLLKGNCLETLKTLADNSVDSIVTDPPYELGFMGKSWDNSGIAYNQDLWAECLRVLKPGGHLLAFSGSRTYHRMTVAIEDAGFEIRDQIMWLYGSGFPKSLDVSKAIDKAVGAEREVVGQNRYAARRPSETANSPVGFSDSMGGSATANITAPATPEAQRWQGWGTALKPAHEPICVARKPLTGTVASNVLEWGTGALNIDASRVPSDDGFEKAWDKPVSTNISAQGGKYISEGNQHTVDLTSNRLVGGRWPANVIHDGSEEVLAGFPTSKSGVAVRGKSGGNTFGGDSPKPPMDDIGYGDEGSAARFFFSTKGDYDGSLWHDLNLHPETANIAEPHLSQPERNDASVLVHVLNLALQEALRCVGLSVERSMTVTANESRLIAESVTQATLSIGQRFWQELSPESISLNLNPVNVVATHEPTGITTITVSHWKSDGSAEPVTFNIMRKNLELGEKDSNARRFMYCAKASKSERNAGLDGLPERITNTATPPGAKGANSPRAGAGRNGATQNFHPTVKPLALMRYLIKLVTPLGGTVLDPFLGSGSTAVAAILEGFDWIGCEMTEDYFPIIEARVEWAHNQPKTLL